MSHTTPLLMEISSKSRITATAMQLFGTRGIPRTSSAIAWQTLRISRHTHARTLYMMQPLMTPPSFTRTAKLMMYSSISSAATSMTRQASMMRRMLS